MVSIVIAAHNEATVIGRCLDALVHGEPKGSPLDFELDIVVVCNGCHDQTADIARSYGESVQVVETEIASKTGALNLGDQHAHGFPRFYVDADIVLTHDALRAVVKAFKEEKILAAAPAVIFDVEGSSYLVRQFYRVWSELPYVKHELLGSGVYALTEEGRSRFSEFPAITADDAFVRLHFAPSERRVIRDVTFSVRVPRDIKHLIKIKIRSHFGNIELKKTFPELWKRETLDHKGSIWTLAKKPSRWPAIAVYVSVRALSRRLAARKLRLGKDKSWERDESTRQEDTSEPLKAKARA